MHCGASGAGQVRGGGGTAVLCTEPPHRSALCICLPMHRAALCRAAPCTSVPLRSFSGLSMCPFARAARGFASSIHTTWNPSAALGAARTCCPISPRRPLQHCSPHTPPFPPPHALFALCAPMGVRSCRAPGGPGIAASSALSITNDGEQQHWAGRALGGTVPRVSHGSSGAAGGRASASQGGI